VGFYDSPQRALTIGPKSKNVSFVTNPDELSLRLIVQKRSGPMPTADATLVRPSSDELYVIEGGRIERAVAIAQPSLDLIKQVHSTIGHSKTT
jgi:hypothetical protein